MRLQDLHTDKINGVIILIRRMGALLDDETVTHVFIKENGRNLCSAQNLNKFILTNDEAFEQ